jgi:asparagine synthase (glutamine-hydrolysing)
MCGIAGIFATNSGSGSWLSEALLVKVTDALISRGPDGSGYWIDPTSRVGLGQRRLAIIDLSPRGAQPMSTPDGKITVTFNGEIYNFLELRKELEGRGCVFKSDSDTEAILHGYREWGIECVSRFRGMFAFALWDSEKEQLYLCRDRLGVKPLHYYSDGKNVLFGSELKALMAHPQFPREMDAGAAGLYFQLGYVPAPRTIFQGTHKVNPGSYMRIDRNGKLEETEYWHPMQHLKAPAPVRPEGEVEEELRALLKEAFSYRMIADVPVGVFLSGGVDSSLVAAVLRRDAGEELSTFSVGFDDPDLDETAWARKVADHLGTKNTELRCTAQEALEIVPRLPEIYDEPFADNSGIPTYLLCRAARQHVKVALSGDGGDEFWCGYTTYTKFASIWRRIESVPRPLRSGLAGASRLLYKRASAFEEIASRSAAGLARNINWSDWRDKLLKAPLLLEARDFQTSFTGAVTTWPEPELARLLVNFQALERLPLRGMNGQSDIFQRMMLFDAQTLLPDNMLVKVDRASMAVGLEAREPMLDHKLVEFALGLPSEQKYDGTTTKRMLRKILYSHVPRELIERPKRGFSVPLTQWLRGPLSELVHDTLAADTIRRDGFFSADYVSRLTADFYAGKKISARRIWNLLVFQMWQNRWLAR